MSEVQTIPADALGALAKAFLDPQTHRATLPLLAGAMLGTAGGLREALMLADRFHRTGSDTVASRLVEASARARLGDMGGALALLKRAVAIDPGDASAVWGLLRALAAAGDRRAMGGVLDKALPSCAEPDDAVALMDLGRPGWTAHGRVERAGAQLSGWIVWREGGARRDVVLDVGGRELRVGVPADRRLSGGARVGRFLAPWPMGAAVIAVRDALTGAPLAGSPAIDDAILDIDRPVPPGDGVTIVVPLHGDAAATARCLDSILEARCEATFRLVLVDDASPSPAIRRLGERLAEEGLAWRLENPVNLGFIRSINRALRWIPDGDVVLLNADTVVAPGWLDRLAAAAHAPGVGTVTPLSNNGELVSVPRPFRPVPLPSRERIEAFDAICARHFSGETVDLPNGIGFCLYVNAAARAAAGLLDAQRYERGYLEEVDYCLRVREAGLRNVAALDVYVGHEGSVSFGLEKRALVRRNAAVLAKRWPAIHGETDAFVAADPLRRVRTGVPWLRDGDASSRTAVVVARRWRQECLLEAAACGEEAVLLVPGDDDESWALQMKPGEPAVPLAPAGDGLDLALADARVSRILLADWKGLSVAQLEALARARVPSDLFLADDAAVTAPRRPGPAGALAAMLVNRVETVIATGPAAASAFEAAWPGRAGAVRLIGPIPLQASPRSLPARRHHVGVLVSDPGPDTSDVVAGLARVLAARRSPVRLVVLGRTADDVALMRLPGVFVAGPAPDAPSLIDAIDTHGCTALILAMREPFFVHPALEAVAASGLPCAGLALGGAGEVLRLHEGSLALDPATTVSGLAEIVDLRWGTGTRATAVRPRVA